MNQTALPLFEQPTPPAVPHFDGETYDPKADHKRLASQFLAVRDVLKPGEPLTLDQIQAELHAKGIYASTASISARVRDLRKAEFGGFTVKRIGLGRGLFSYQMTGVGR